MKLVPFIAASAADAVAQIRSELGPDAIVVNVRQIAADGLARLWQKPRIEVLAYRPPPDRTPSLAPNSSRLLVQSAAELADLRIPSRPAAARADPRSWRVSELLENSGFLPVPAQQVLEHLRQQHGEMPPPSLADEVLLTRSALAQLWRKPQPFIQDSMRPHLFVGASGAGKTTVLCKWLTQIVLVEGRKARVWRLDSAIANTAEHLSLYCEILGVPVERFWQLTDDAIEPATSFIDIAGVDWRNSSALRQLQAQLKNYLNPCLHLVLNAAYDTHLLLAQIRAFDSFPIEDLILTHLDEELRWGKIWNLVLGTKYSIRFLSAGQNIPGEFSPATADKIFVRQFSA